MTRLTGPVELYVILSGYGLYYTYQHKRTLDCFKRLKKLYGLYLFTLLIFVFLACLFNKDGYPGTISDVILNITGWNTTYNVTIWFLFPYAVMVVLASVLFKMVDKKPIIIIVVSCGLYFGAYFASWLSHHNYITPGYALNELIRVLNMVFPFITGAAICKYEVVSKTKSYFKARQKLLLMSLIGICIIRISTDFDFMLQLAYSLGLIVLVSAMHKPAWVVNCLSFFGKHSTSMWLIHAYFIWYLFDEFPYTLKYPILIFGMSLILTTIAAIFIDWCYLKIQNAITEKYAK